MSYRRVIPRDLFNESNLLKCLGQLYIKLESTPNHRAGFAVEDVDWFDVQQNADDGSIYVANVPFLIAGRAYHLSRPLNSRQPWPLWVTTDEDAVAVFDETGALASEFLELITKR